MAKIRTVDFLPEIFQTSTNKQFLAATLDQLVQEPSFKKIQGYVGRRVGPGVNPNDSYITETSAERANYQLEPGVILKNSIQSTKIDNAITYPGITDALALQGAITNKADRLYTSEYYTWDPFVDFDKFVNFSQYYWLPTGPNPVSVEALAVPETKNFVVTRNDSSYTFSNIAGPDPDITLLCGGQYTFQVSQNVKENITFRVSNQGTSAFVINYENNPTLTLIRGNTYTFELSLNAPWNFYIKTQASLGVNNQYTSGVTNNGTSVGSITFVVPTDAPDVLYYCNNLQPNMSGQFNIINAQPGTGDEFWIQSQPGVNGRQPATPNISSRLTTANGVTNNGVDLGTITFDVPLSSAQNYYYNLPRVPSVDLATDLQFDQINNVPLAQFLATYGGIDGISGLVGRTLVFISNPTTGWEFNQLPAGFDSDPFAYADPISDPDLQHSVWQINYVTVDDEVYIELISTRIIPLETKFEILFGTQWSSTNWYRNDTGNFEEVPLLTAANSVLYYQDSTNPAIVGKFRIIDPSQSSTLDISEIIGQKTYTSPNGVVFTNGLKVEFTGSVTPTSYQNNQYYVEGVGTAIELLPVTNFVTPEIYVQNEISDDASSLYPDAPILPDYLTINRASPDLNPWTRSNRWFHIDVINATAEYNNTVAVLDNRYRGKRPILEYRAGTKLFNFGTQAKQPVNIIDFNETDAFSNINGTTGYSTDGYTFVDGSRVVFAADADPLIRNKIYVVEFFTPDTVPPLIQEPIINLVPATDSTVLVDQSVLCLSGLTRQGLTYYYDGVEWITSQQKIDVNQAPLFDIYDPDGVSYGNRLKYPSTNFIGCKLFSYAQGTGTDDLVLKFPLKYLSLANIGDIVFDNNLYTDTFIYTRDSVSTTVNVSEGYVREYIDRVLFKRETGWQTAITKSRARQQFRFTYDGSPLQLDVKVIENGIIPGIQLFVGSQFQESTAYTYTTTDVSTVITLLNTYVIGDIIEVTVLSDQASKVAFYQIPVNLENNPFNINSPTFTLGTARAQYETICENLINLSGPINGANNTRDLGDIIPYGTNILQQSAPLTLAGYFMRTTAYNIFNSLEYSSREYEQYKAQLLDAAVRNDYTNYTIPNMLTAVITDLTVGRNQLNPFYWTDMLPASSIFKKTVVDYNAVSVPVFDLSTTYNFTSSNYQSVLVYINDVILTAGYDYVVSADAPHLTITIPLTIGDVITIQEYATTYGTFVPNTPTKLGLYPAFKPQIYFDTGYLEPTWVILGHDGSKTIAFGNYDETNSAPDFRDQLLLEFETRIFNNLKIKSEIPLQITEVVPGQFRTTDYTLAEINQILAPSFLSWIGWNKLAYQTQDYIATGPKSEFTWNYITAGNRLTGNPDNTALEDPLPTGAWRGIYQYFYDTISPDTTPWEMLGFSQKPTWWENEYGLPSPITGGYTSGNLVLWDDLAAGLVKDPAGFYILPRYVRPDLAQVIPVDSEGNLLSPFDNVVGLYDASQFQKSWAFGDEGPVEYTWRSSSSYPFAVMRMLALTRPAEFFALFADRDLYKFNTEFDQYLLNNRYRLDATGIQIYGNGVSKASYIDWIVDYNQQLGINSTTALTTELANLDVRLCYRMGAFTDKQYMQIYTEKSSPNSLNSSLLLPDDSYNLLLYKNQPFNRVIFSSVIFQVVEDGYAVFGYSITNPYFDILVSKTAGTRTIISAGGTTVTVPNTYTQNIAQIPYGYVFSNDTVVCDFLLSYGALLESQGLVFDDRENGHTLNWNQMAQEFLYWANQGWAVGTIINLNPGATSATVVKDNAIVDSIVAQTPENLILDQNRNTLPVSDLVVDRIDNAFKVRSLTEQTISYLDIRFVSFENMVVLDNVSIFNDLIYNPATGARQGRINVMASVGAEWNGQLDAQGFILNNDATVLEWQPYIKYAKGEIVIYKNNYWSAQTIVQPKAEFNYSDWVKSDYTKIQRGLLANIPNKANQLANSYNTYTANLNQDNDLLSYGLIGFRPRTYMTSLNLDDVSQVNLYQQFIKDKGTLRSVRLLTNANLGKEVAQYDIFENWAILRATYGANANRSFIELRLNAANLRSNPSIIQVVQPGQISAADQPILLTNIWRESYKLTSTDILPTTLITPVDLGLPTAGYVNFNDVDITVFSLEGELGISSTVLNTIGTGTIIWAAKSNQYDWNVYRSGEVPGYIDSVTSNLNGTSLVTFAGRHGLSVDDIIVIKSYSPEVNGVYRVLAIPKLNSITIALNTTVTSTGHGLAYQLESMRVAQASDVLHLPYANDLLPGARAWVDNNGQGRWQVLEKQNPFLTNTPIEPSTPITNGLFGTCVTQSKDNLMALIGSPGYANGGALYAYLRDSTGNFGEVSVLTLIAENADGYGRSAEIGNQNWAIAGAPSSNGNQGYATTIYRASASNAFVQRQIFVSPDLIFGTEKFGSSVAVSTDERWMYIGAPGDNKVHAYGRVDLEIQSATFLTNGTTRLFNFDGKIVIDSDTQVSVVLNNKLLRAGLDYTVTGTIVNLNVIPSAGQVLIVSRNNVYQLDHGLYYEIEQDSATGFGSGAQFTIDRTRGEYNVTLTASGIDYSIGDILTINAATIDGGTSPTNDLTITVDDVTDGGITAFTPTGNGVDNNNDFDLYPYLYTVSDIYSFTVTVNDTLYRPGVGMDYTFNEITKVITFTTIPDPGAQIVVSSLTYFKYIDTLTVNGIPSTAEFGCSVDTTTDGRQVAIGAFNDNAEGHPHAGAVYVFDRGVQQFIVTDATQTTYPLPVGHNGPIAVVLNNQYLNNAAQFINGQFNVVGDTVVINSGVLSVGDALVLEYNIFSQLQKIVSDALFDEAKFGFDVLICTDNDEIYIGAPNDGTVMPGAGSVAATQNVGRSSGYITSTIANPTLTTGDTLRINNMIVYVPLDNTVNGLKTAINNAGIPNVQAAVDTGLLTISIINIDASVEGAYIDVLPGFTTTVFDALGFELFYQTQTITSPLPVDSAAFGYSVWMDTEYNSLIVGAPTGTLVEPTTFDQGKTYFDEHSTSFSTTLTQSGAVYTYDFLESANSTTTNPGHWVFGQQIYDTAVQPLDNWGQAVNYTSGRLLIGSPGNDHGDSSGNFGRVGAFNNLDQLPAWTVIHEQQPVVNVYQINSAFMYDRLQSSESYFFDFFNPLQGKILGAARQNIDFIGSVDPAKYNQGLANNDGTFWASNRVGQIWWDTNSVRFIDPNQDDIVYASRRWGQVFPGSTIDVYQWVSSSVAPSSYTGPGTPYSTTSYTINTSLNAQGTFSTNYYFWVTGIDTIDTVAGKTLSTTGIARYIEDPRSSGIPYIAALNSSTVAIYNGLDFLSAADTILHIDYDRELTDANIHTEYELIVQDDPNSFISSSLYRKLQDSFCGANTVGAKVPDPLLSPAEQYGVQFRPRQSMFIDRFAALQNYLTRANSVLALYPITEIRSFSLLNSSDPEPSSYSGQWDKRLATIEELSYQNLYAVPLGYRYLIMSDSTNNGLWTIYTVVLDSALPTAPRISQLTQVQTYDTRKYWSHIDWYQAGYNYNITPVAEVPVYAALATLTLKLAPVGSSVKVTTNAQGKFEIYLRGGIDQWDRVGLQDGTIAFDESIWNYQVGSFGYDIEVFDAQYFDQEPTIETRKIIQAINEELFINELAIERNRLLTLIFKVILSEFTYPDWLTKTSLIDVLHNIRELIPFQTYRRDNQEFVLDYIQEVKPYHVQVKQFNLVYNGLDSYLGGLTDFDSPSYYDTSLDLPQYVNPILLPYDTSSAVGTGTPSTLADTPSNAEIWAKTPWDAWYNNYLLGVQSVVIVTGGSGYTVAPTVIVTGDSTVQAEMVATINMAGEVTGVSVLTPGSGYTTTASVVFSGGDGAGAKAYAVMGNDLVRSMKTVIKYDRYQYNSDITDWSYEVATYPQNIQVRYADKVWSATSTIINAPVIVTGSGVGDAYALSLSSTTGITIGMLVTGFGIAPDTVVSNITSGGVILSRVLLANINNLVTFYLTFDPELWTEISSDSLSGIDRTQGFYLPFVNEPGRSLPLLIDGLEYPGVQVKGPGFNQNTGYDVGNYSINPYDNISYDASGRPTYDYKILDAMYGSQYLDIYLGTRPTDINVDGGGYIDVFSSYAPEELVPGSEFDTLDFRVYTDTGLEFRIFQDMRGVQATYRMTPSSTTTLTQDLGPTDDIIYVDDANALPEPNFAANLWGVITINGERIMYRERDTVNNTVSSLLRGTAGTANGDIMTSDWEINPLIHPTGTPVYDLGRGNLLPIEYQDYIISDSKLGDGVTQVYQLTGISYNSVNPDAIEVYVGGIRVQTGYLVEDPKFGKVFGAPPWSVDTTTIVFDVAPPVGVEVTLLVRQGHSWYNPATPLLTLQDTDTPAARFLRGE